MAWWETCSSLEFVLKFMAHPFVVLKQLGVACDMLQAPLGSNQEEFPTLSPNNAAQVLYHRQRGK